MDVNPPALKPEEEQTPVNLPLLPGRAAGHSRLSPTEALELAFSEYAPNTRRAYARAFRTLQQWAGIRQLTELADFDSLRLLEYKQHLRNQGKKPATINQQLSAIRKICGVLNEVGCLPANPFETNLIRAEKVPSGSNKGTLRLSQLHALMEANQRMNYDSRNEALLRIRNGLVLRFLYLTAARRSEAAGLCWEDLQQDGSFQVVVLKHTKSGEPQKLKLRNELHEELTQWKCMLEKHGIDSPWVFPSLGFRTRGGKMSGKGINDIITKLGTAIGLNISAHYLRHTAITLALEMGEPLQKVQAYARHASANTTIRYFHDLQLLEKNPTDRLPMI